jgi:hypothetical protein
MHWRPLTIWLEVNAMKSGSKHSVETRAKMSATAKARWAKVRAELSLSPKEVEFILRRSERRRARLARNPHQVQAQVDRQRRRRELKRQLAADDVTASNARHIVN